MSGGRQRDDDLVRDLESLRAKLAGLKRDGADEALLRTTALELRVIETDLRAMHDGDPPPPAGAPAP